MPHIFALDTWIGKIQNQIGILDWNFGQMHLLGQIGQTCESDTFQNIHMHYLTMLQLLVTYLCSSRTSFTPRVRRTKSALT